MSSELTPSIAEQQPNPNLLEPSRGIATALRTRLGRLAAVGMLVASAFTVQEAIDPVAAHADTTTTYSDLGYPYKDAPCEFGSAGGDSCTNPAVGMSWDKYDWYVDEDGDGQFGSSSNRTGCGSNGASGECWDQGYEYRNCTDYVQWRESQVGVTVPGTWQNGGQWYDNAPAAERSSTPKAWDAAVVPGNPGHVAFVESVNTIDPTNAGNDNITVSEYNHDAKGDGDTRTGKASDMGFSEYVDFGVHPAGDPPPSSTQYLDVLNGSSLSAKQNLGDPWTPETAGAASNVQAAGTRMAFMDGSGVLWAKDGINGAWIAQTGGVNQYVVTPNLIAIRIGSTMYAKTDVAQTFTTEATGVTSIQAGGNRIAFTDGNGGVWVKDGVGGTWYHETDNVSQYAVNSNFLVVRSGSSISAKANLTDQWTPETAGATSMQVGGNRIGMVDGSGYLWVKDGVLGAWNQESQNVSQYALTSNLLVVRNGSAVSAKANLTDQWTPETAGAISIQAGGNRMGIIDGLGYLLVKDGINGTWYQESQNVTQYALASTQE